MSCLGPCYSPNPTRAWSRVQGPCSYAPINPGAKAVYVPLLGREVIPADAFFFEQLLRKGNVLQYKNNAANWSKAQKYAKIVRRENANRTTWATQSLTFTDPNTKLLKRVGAVNITRDGIQTDQDITCRRDPLPDRNDDLPPIVPSGAGGKSNPIIPPPPPPTDPGSGNIIPSVPDTGPDDNDDQTIIQDGGILICNIQEDPCTGATIVNPNRSRIHPTTASDVPGRIRLLYWDPKLQTWIPRQRRTMSNSLNKWPINAVLFNGFGDCATTADVIEGN